MGVVRRVVLAVLGVSFLLLSAIARYRVNPRGFNLQYTHPAIILAIWLLPLLLVTVVSVRSQTGRSLLSHFAASRSRGAAVVVAVLAYLAAVIPTEIIGWVIATRVALSSTGAILLIFALLPPVSRSGIAALRRAGSWLLRDLKPLHFLAMTSGFTFVFANLASRLVFQHIPHVQDSINQVFQGRIFASGRVWLPARFDDYFTGYWQVFNDGLKVFAVEPFGHSLLLALGSLVHAEWVVNPLLGAAEIVVLYLLGKEVYDEATGRVAALLGAASPFLLFMSSEYMNHASSLLFLSLFLLFFVRTLRSERQGRGEPRKLDPLLSGLCLAMALNIRPLTALAVSAPVALGSVFLIFRTRGRVLGRLLLLALPVVLGLGAFAFYNHLTTGSATMSGYEAYGMLQYRHLGFGVGFGNRGFPDWPGPHTPLLGLVHTSNNLVALNRYLFESPLPGLVLVLLLFLTLPRNPADYWLLATFAALSFAYFFYYFQFLTFGPRFLYEGLAPLLLLSARGLIEFPRFVGRVVSAAAQVMTRETLLTGLALSLCFTAVIGLRRVIADYRSSYWGIDNRIGRWVAQNRIDNAVVFTGPAGPRTFLQEFYGAAFLCNTLDFRGPVVYARDRGDFNYLMMCQFPGRTFYRANRDTIRQIVAAESLRFTPTIQALAEAGRFIGEHKLSDHRCILLPFREAGALVDTTGLRCRTYRNLDYVLCRDRSALANCAPALGVFMSADENTYSSVFAPMWWGWDYVAGGCRFELLFRTEDGECAVYDIRPVAP